MNRIRIKEALLHYESMTGKKVTQIELAQYIWPKISKELAAHKLSMIVNGHTKSISMVAVRKISVYLNVSLDFLLKDYSGSIRID